MENAEMKSEQDTQGIGEALHFPINLLPTSFLPFRFSLPLSYGNPPLASHTTLLPSMQQVAT